MRILVVSQSFYPDTFAINDIVQGFVKQGHKVSVLTGLPDYTTSYIPEEYKHGKRRHEFLGDVEVFRVPTIARRHGPVWRSLNYISFAINGSIKALFGKWEEFDVIYVWEVSPVTMAIPAIALKRRFHKPLFLYCLDIWPECVKAMGFKEETLPYRIIHRLSSSIYKKCDHIAVSSTPFFDYLEKINGCDRSKMSYIPQFASDELANRDFTKVPNGRTDFLYIGNIGFAQSFDTLIRAAALLKDRNDVWFHIVGGGAAFEQMKDLAEETGASKIMTFYGPKPFKEAVEYYKICDACVLTLDGSNHIGDTLPGKLQTYMAAGKPVIGAMNGAGQEVIRESTCGRCVNAGDTDLLAKVLADFANNKEKYRSCGDIAREYFFDNFTEGIFFNRILKELMSIINESVND